MLKTRKSFLAENKEKYFEKIGLWGIVYRSF
jgi:hypothetical protein